MTAPRSHDPRLWARRTTREMDDAPTGRVCAILPVGATEAHGPHLPLDADVVIAGAVARRAARRLADHGVEALVLPPLAYGVTIAAGGLPGSVGVGKETFRALVSDILADLADQGIPRVAICNHHLEPEQLRVLEGLADDPPADVRVVLPRHWRTPHRTRLGDEFEQGDAHAGRYETSIVLAADPDAVREDERRDLEERRVGLLEAFRAGKTTFPEMGAPDAWVGDPAAATAGEGESLVEVLAGILVDAVEEDRRGA